MPDSEDRVSWRRAFRRPYDCPDVFWTPGVTDDLAAGEYAISKAFEQLQKWGIPTGRNQSMFSTWGDQAVFLDGFLVIRGEPELNYRRPIYGGLVVGPMALRFVCHMDDDIDPPKRRLRGEESVPSFDDLRAIIAWQVEMRRQRMTEQVSLLRNVQQPDDAQAIYAHHAEDFRSNLPDASSSVGMEPVEVSGPADITELISDFRERLALVEVEFDADEDGVLHTVWRCPELTGRARYDKRMLPAAWDDLCELCGHPLNRLRSTLEYALPSSGRVLITQDRDRPASVLKLDNVIRWCVRPWASVDTPHGAPYDSLTSALIPVDVAEAIGSYLDGMAEIGAESAFRLG